MGEENMKGETDVKLEKDWPHGRGNSEYLRYRHATLHFCFPFLLLMSIVNPTVVCLDVLRSLPCRLHFGLIS